MALRLNAVAADGGNPPAGQPLPQSEVGKVFFHEMLHTLGYIHGDTPEVAYSCETCCFGGYNSDMCRLCAANPSRATTPRYYFDMVLRGEASEEGVGSGSGIAFRMLWDDRVRTGSGAMLTSTIEEGIRRCGVTGFDCSTQEQGFLRMLLRAAHTQKNELHVAGSEWRAEWGGTYEGLRGFNFGDPAREWGPSADSLVSEYTARVFAARSTGRSYAAAHSLAASNADIRTLCSNIRRLGGASALSSVTPRLEASLFLLLDGAGGMTSPCS
jgi:hypothetical protein